MATKKKRIGIPGWVIGDTTFGVKKAYLDFIAQFGKPVILAPGNYELEQIDLLLLPGGADVMPSRYNEFPTFQCGNPNIMLEAFDSIMLPKYIEAGVPVIGICRGINLCPIS